MMPVESPLIAALREYNNPIVIACFGVLIGTTFYFQSFKVIYLFCLCFLFLILFLLVRKEKLLLLTLFILVGFLYIFCYSKYLTSDFNCFLNKKYIYVAEILSSSDESNSFYCKKYFLKLKNLLDENQSIKNIDCKVLIYGSHYEEYFPGDVVQITGILKLPKKAILPTLHDERRYLLSKGIKYVLKTDPGSLVFLDMPYETLLRREINQIRNKLVSINSSYLSSNNLALVNGILLGSKAVSLPLDLKEKLRSLGLSHITSASGFNVSVLIFGIFSLFRVFSVLPKRKTLSLIISIFAVIFYSAIADFSSSILRAAVFIVLVLLGNMFQKKIKVLPGISFIILLFFAFNPLSILDIGLQLSILSFLGIMLFLNEFQEKVFPFIHSKLQFLVSIFLQTLIAQIMVIPLIVFYFHNIQLLGLVSNIIAVPLASLILITGLLNLLIGLIPNLNFINGFISFFIKSFSGLFLSWIELLDKFSFKQLFLSNLSFYFLILIYVFILFCLLSFFVLNIRKATRFFLPAFIVVSVMVYICTDTQKYLKVFFIPRYNQEAVLIVSPDKTPMYLSTRNDDTDKSQLHEYLRLNSIPANYIFYDLNDVKNNNLVISHKKFSLEIIKRYNDMISSTADYLKLPILMKKDPDISMIFTTLPKNIIVNDYKRLSKKSIRDIEWLRLQPCMIFLLSRTGTITLVSDGINSKLDY